MKIIFVQNARMIYNGPSPACLLTTMMMMMIILYLSLLEKFQPLQSHPPPSGTKKGPTTREKEEFPYLLKSEALRGDFDPKSQAERGSTPPCILPGCVTEKSSILLLIYLSKSRSVISLVRIPKWGPNKIVDGWGVEVSTEGKVRHLIATSPRTPSCTHKLIK